MAGQVASALRRGPAFLVGDAAHRTTPMGGVGMNTAIHAAHNLGWKLAWVLRGWAGEALLDSYQAERLPVGGTTCAGRWTRARTAEPTACSATSATATAAAADRARTPAGARRTPGCATTAPGSRPSTCSTAG